MNALWQVCRQGALDTCLPHYNFEIPLSEAGSSAIVRPAEQVIRRDVADLTPLFAGLKVPDAGTAPLVTNASFELPKPDDSQRGCMGWRGSRETGVFHNQSGHGPPLENIHGSQIAYMNTQPGNELYQDLTARFVTDHAYTLTDAMAARADRPHGAGSTMEIRLYYRDDSNEPIVIAKAVVDYDSLSDQRLQDFTVQLPAVEETAPWRGKPIGVWFVSLAGGDGDWTLDDVRLTQQAKGKELRE